MIHEVAVIGLGNMGLGIATSLARKGFAVRGVDLSAVRLSAAAAEGIGPASLDEALTWADAVLLSLPYAKDVEAALTGTAALLARRDRRVIAIDTSTADPATSRRLAARLAAAGHAHLDAPVSGGPAAAAEGALTMMIGGTEADVAEAHGVIDAVARKAIHVGPSGAGNVAKLVNNMLVAAHMITTGEALRLAEAAGVSAESVLAVVNEATGRSAISQVHVPRWVLPGGFDSGFSAGLMRKDVGLAVEMACESGVALPLCAEAARLWREADMADSDDFTRMAAFRP